MKKKRHLMNTFPEKYKAHGGISVRLEFRTKNKQNFK
jgi:hypothetical protein